MKLVIVTVRFRGKVNQKMIEVQLTNGKAQVPSSLIREMAAELGATGSQKIQIG